jgi:hypothetical protein
MTSYTGQSVAVASAYRNTLSGGRDGHGPFNVYGYSIAVDNTRTISSITLPDDTDVEILAITAVT